MFQTDVPLTQLERVLCEVERWRGELMHEFDVLQKSPQAVGVNGRYRLALTALRETRQPYQSN